MSSLPLLCRLVEIIRLFFRKFTYYFGSSKKKMEKPERCFHQSKIGGRNLCAIRKWSIQTKEGMEALWEPKIPKWHISTTKVNTWTFYFWITLKNISFKFRTFYNLISRALILIFLLEQLLTLKNQLHLQQKWKLIKHPINQKRWNVSCLIKYEFFTHDICTQINFNLFTSKNSVEKIFSILSI